MFRRRKLPKPATELEQGLAALRAVAMEQGYLLAVHDLMKAGAAGVVVPRFPQGLAKGRLRKIAKRSLSKRLGVA